MNHGREKLSDTVNGMVGCALLCVLAVFAMQALAVQAISPSVGSSAKHFYAEI